MKPQTKQWLVAALMLVSAPLARAELIVHDIGSYAANTLNDLGRDFVIGCAFLAAGMVAAVIIYKKK